MSQTLDKSLKRENLEKEINEVVPDADQWRRTPNDQLGGKRPSELIDGNDNDREQVRNLVEAIKHGMVS
jgi:hypothetical protein